MKTDILKQYLSARSALLTRAALSTCGRAKNQVPISFMKKTAHVLLAITIGSLQCFYALGADAPAKADEVLTNPSIIELQKIGFGENIVLDKIKTSKCDFDVSINGLKQLKEAKISDQVIQAMVAAASAAKGGEVKPAGKGDVNDPNAAHDLGIWLLQKNNGQNKMTQLETTAFSHTAMGSGWGAEFGASRAMRAVLNGSQAKLQLAERRPTFYFYLGDGLSAATSPIEFTLARLEVKKAKNRLLLIGRQNRYGGSTTGVDLKAVRAFDFEKVGAGIHRIVPREDLADGEYCFCQGALAAGAGGKVFEFGVSAK
jgi:hypothetical protein